MDSKGRLRMSWFIEVVVWLEYFWEPKGASTGFTPRIFILPTILRFGWPSCVMIFFSSRLSSVPSRCRKIGELGLWGLSRFHRYLPNPERV
jgi:hypothetical protein